jgi:hypothetical protein
MSCCPLKVTSTMRQLIAVAAGLTLAGTLIAVTMGVFMETNVAIPTGLFGSHASSHAIEAIASPPSQSATPSPQFVTITQAVSVGATILSAGTRLEFVSKAGSDALIRYKGAEYAIPISATDLK